MQPGRWSAALEGASTTCIIAIARRKRAIRRSPVAPGIARRRVTRHVVTAGAGIGERKCVARVGGGVGDGGIGEGSVAGRIGGIARGRIAGTNVSDVNAGSVAIDIAPAVNVAGAIESRPVTRGCVGCIDGRRSSLPKGRTHPRSIASSRLQRRAPQLRLEPRRVAPGHDLNHHRQATIACALSQRFGPQLAGDSVCRSVAKKPGNTGHGIGGG